MALVGNQPTPELVVLGQENFTMNSLFQVGNFYWDVDVVRDLFSPTDATVILGIPISHAVHEDTWYWLAEKDGFYSIRCAYKLIQEQNFVSAPTETGGFWRKMWAMKMPPKSKDLIWRAASSCLSTKTNLCIKKVLSEDICPFCNVFAETEFHVLVQCTFAWSCWEFFGFSMAGREAPSLLDWLDKTLQMYHGDYGNCVIMLCWALWSARNDLIWKHRTRNVRDVVVFADSTLDQWLKAQGNGNLPSLSPLQKRDGAELWTKSILGIKVNVGATIFDHDHKFGYGCVVRSSDGGLIAATAGCKIGRVSPELAEIMSIREALSWLKSHNFSQVVIEADRLVCVEAIRSFAALVSAFGLVVEECRNMLNNLSHVSLVFVKRSTNRAAHFIAQNSRQEVTHSFTHRKQGKVGWMAIKLDMAKGFDRVKWSFLRRVMEKFYFPSNFTNLFISCLSTASFSFSINQQLRGSVIPSRGIRQGNPLSPYLFLLCSEGHSSLITQQVNQRLPRNQALGLKIARNAPIISHLFFADDSILFSAASPSAAVQIKDLLHADSLASGRLVNYDKSSLYFSPNTSDLVKN
uniref:Reverse transcriptase n=1 Tax=Cannabis sativa TaxID=3483 RepID=A0A803PR48_CANSA